MKTPSRPGAGKQIAPSDEFLKRQQQRLEREEGKHPPAPPPVAVREQALRALEPRAIEVLEAQLNSPDERIAQQAAKVLLEHQWGKPVSRQEVKQDSITQIEYITTAAPKWKRN